MIEIKNFSKMIKTRIFFKISFPLIILGLFLIVVFISLSYQKLTGTEFILILFLIVVFIFLFSFAISQKFTQPVEKLKSAAQKLKEGNLKTRIYLETKDEFEDLAIFLNQIAEELERSQVIVEQTKKAVDLKVRAKTKELEETIKGLQGKIKERVMELQKQIVEFENFRKLTIEREKKMIELKKEIKKLKEEFKKVKK